MLREQAAVVQDRAAQTVRSLEERLEKARNLSEEQKRELQKALAVAEAELDAMRAQAADQSKAAAGPPSSPLSRPLRLSSWTANSQPDNSQPDNSQSDNSQSDNGRSLANSRSLVNSRSLANQDPELSTGCLPGDPLCYGL